MKQNRRAFILSGAGAAAAAGMLGGAPAVAANLTPMMTADAALEKLLAGNARYAEGKPHCYPVTPRLEELADGQAPFATVLGCSDSRVPVETVFDHQPGDIFTVRIAGNFVTTAGLGSIEFAVAVLKCPLVMVLGHSKCGAVNAAVEYVDYGKTFPGHIMDLAKEIAPAAKAARGHSGDRLTNAIEANVRDAMHGIKTSTPILSEAVSNKTLKVVGAVYELKTGRVRMLS